MITRECYKKFKKTSGLYNTLNLHDILNTIFLIYACSPKHSILASIFDRDVGRSGRQLSLQMASQKNAFFGSTKYLILRVQHPYYFLFHDLISYNDCEQLLIKFL